MTATTHTKNGPAANGSRLKRIVMFLLDGLGKPGAWLLLSIVVFVNERIYGASIYGTFWMFFCILFFFLARIATALEATAKKS